MSEEKAQSFSFFTPGSLQTFIAASFVIALLALGMTIYNFSRTTQAVSGVLDLQLLAAKQADKSGAGMEEAVTDLQTRLEAVETKLAELEAKAAAPPPAEPEGTE